MQNDYRAKLQGRMRKALIEYYKDKLDENDYKRARLLTFDLFYGPSFNYDEDEIWEGFSKTCDTLILKLDEVMTELWYDDNWEGIYPNEPDAYDDCVLALPIKRQQELLFGKDLAEYL